ncbi:MAG: hypothetical protein KAS66_13560 [Candidatus Omnitrophica bacterium]|nr:hypothetical protein [Candidatus Omnitrophota bacterium]
MQVFEDNVKKFGLKKNKLLCKCGSVRYDIEITEGDREKGDFSFPWVMITCKQCGHILFYNGA